MTEDEAYAALQVVPGAHPRVVLAAHAVLREMALRDPSDAAPSLLVRVDRARRVLHDAGRLDAPADARP